MRNFRIIGLILISQVAFADYSSMYPPQVADLSADSQEVNQYNWRNAVEDVNRPAGVANLPIPTISQQKTLSMTLQEAILLSLRNNPDVQSSELDRVISKFNLLTAHREFEPLYTLTGAATFTKGTVPAYSASSGINVKSAMGTQYGMTFTPNTVGGAGPGKANFTVSQPLLKGFGERIATYNWYAALDSENTSRLNFKSTIISQVVSVIQAYRSLVQDYLNLDIQRLTLEHDAKTLKFAELKYKVGQSALSELLQQKSTYQTNRLSFLRQNRDLIQDRQNLLQTLGLQASADVQIDTKLDFSALQRLPTLPQAIKIALRNNVSYQTALIDYRSRLRTLERAIDNNRWSLDMTAAFSFGGPPTTTSITNGAITTITTTPPSNPASLGFALTIPINDVEAEQAVVAARIGVEQGDLNLEKARLALVRQITNQMEQLQNQISTLATSKKQVEFQRTALEQEQIKLSYGRSTAFQVGVMQDSLLQAENSYVSDKIALLNLITSLNQDLGITLDEWCITLRY